MFGNSLSTWLMGKRRLKVNSTGLRQEFGRYKQLLFPKRAHQREVSDPNFAYK